MRVVVSLVLLLSSACGDDAASPADSGADAGDAGRMDAAGDAVADAPPTGDGSVDAGPPIRMTIDFSDPSHDVGGPIPDCASTLMRFVHMRAMSEVDRGSVPAGWLLTGRNAADPMMLRDGPEIFPKMAELIAEAKHEVAFQTFVWEQDSEPAQEILRAIETLEARRLADPSRDGPVRVRMLIDASTISFGSLPIGESLPVLAAAFEAMDLDPSAVVWEVAAYEHEAFGNLHVKNVVVDGLTALITGANPQHHHDYDEPWHDAGFVVRGEVATALLADFEDAWLLSRKWTCGGTAGDPATCAEATVPSEYTILVDPALDDACVPMMVTMRVADINPASNRVDNTQDQAFLAAFANARDMIHMQTPNLNDDAAKAALLDAVRRDVTVDIVLSYYFNQLAVSAPGQGGPNDQNTTELYDTLVGEGFTDACDRLRVRWYSYDGTTAVEGNGPRASHVKYLTIDDQIAIVGSANMDTQAWNNSREVNVVIDHPATVRAWDDRSFLVNHSRGIVPLDCAP